MVVELNPFVSPLTALLPADVHVLLQHKNAGAGLFNWKEHRELFLVHARTASQLLTSLSRSIAIAERTV